MGKIAYFGDEITSKLFLSFGFDVFTENLVDNFLNAYKNDKYYILIVSEEEQQKILKVYEELNKKLLPVVIFLPSKGKREMVNYKYIKKLTEKAIGVDILEKGE
ncbi:MAG: V-type ATP synthase subunit F [Caldisericia bacterium]|jgi:vacuolar-type H+-ATPase subunit F/Vma7|nr:V-type ATP synthase subunit F [Caldisericia bacterium]